MRKGFTLIELLVVIAIIGILSAVVLASLNAARERGRMGAAKQQAATIERGIGSEAVGWWTFDDCSGTLAQDNASGFAATVPSGAWSTDTPNGRSCSLSFDGTNHATASVDRDIQDVRTGSATRTLWFKTSQTTNSYLFWKADGGINNGMEIEIGTVAVGKLRCRAKATGSSAEADMSTLSNTYNDGKWHFVACILDRTKGTITLIVDGSQRAEGSASFLAGLDLNAAGSTFFPNNAPAYTGYIDEVRMYASSLTIAQVQELYAQGKEAGSEVLAARP